MMKCSKTVSDGWHGHQCTRNAVISEDGKSWCKQHAPSSVQARRKKAYDRFDKLTAEKAVQRKLDKLRHEIADEVAALFSGDFNFGGKLEQLVVQYKNLKRKHEQGGGNGRRNRHDP